MIRLFVAIDLPQTVRRELRQLCAGVPGAKWLAADQFHLTLRFIGSVDGAVFADIAYALAAISMPALDLRCAGVGSWGDKSRAHLLWAGIEPNAALDNLQAKIESTLVRAGIAPERRNFHPHVTLARLKGAPTGRIAEFLTHHGGFATASFVADQFTLYSSFLGHGGAIHRVEAVYPLGEGLGERFAPAPDRAFGDD
jgi:2'-5' RNA ligase